MKSDIIVIPIKNMNCGSCVSKINTLFGFTQGIYSIKANVFTKEIKINFNRNIISKGKILDILSKNGFIALKNEDKNEIPLITIFNYLVINLARKNIFLIMIFILIQLHLFINLKRKNETIFSLIFLSSFISFLYGFMLLMFNLTESISYFRISSILFSFLMIGKFIEDAIKAKNMKYINLETSTKFNSIDEFIKLDKEILNKILTKKTNILKSDNCHDFGLDKFKTTVKIHEIVVDDYIVVEKGKLVPTDGVLISDKGFFDEQMLSGESMPVYKKRNDKVFAGTRNVLSNCILRVTRIQKDTLQGQIITYLHNSHFRTPNMNIALFNRVLGIYCLFVMITYYSLYFLGIKPEILYSTESLKLLVPIKIVVSIFIVACPCSISLCEPLIFLVVSNLFFKKGVFLKNIDSLKKKVNMVVFDKTGTLTSGFEIQEIELCSRLVQLETRITLSKIENFLNNLNLGDINYFLMVIQENIDHPVAKCMFEFVKENVENCKYSYKLTKNSFNYVSGTGIEGTIIVEQPSWIEHDMSPYYEIKFKIFKSEMTYSLILENILVAKFMIKEILRDGSLTLITELLNCGFNVSILSGDTYESVKQIADSLGICNFLFNHTLQEKLEYISESQALGNTVMMIGDGLNDLLALRKADIGVSFNVFNSKTSVSILNERILNIQEIIKMGAVVQKRIFICYLISTIYNLFALVIVSGFFIPFGIYSNPEQSCFSMFISFLGVILISITIK